MCGRGTFFSRGMSPLFLFPAFAGTDHPVPPKIFDGNGNPVYSSSKVRMRSSNSADSSCFGAKLSPAM